MHFNTFISSREDIEACSATNSVKEVLLEPRGLAREGRLSTQVVNELNAFARSLKLRTVLVWDVLMTDDEFEICTNTLRELDVRTFSAVRVQCRGAARYLQANFPETRIQFIAENGFNNIYALEAVLRQLGSSIERIILSLELPELKISQFVKRLPVETELLGAGRILLFHSRRRLLENNSSESQLDWNEAIASSEDSHERPFPTLENEHGTFLFLDKDQFILHRIGAFSHPPTYLRLDLRHLSEFPRSATGIEQISFEAKDNPDALRARWPRPTRAPFFKSNQTTKQFRFLSSEIRFERDEHCVAEVLGAERGRYTIARSIEKFSVPGNYTIVDPNGVRSKHDLFVFKTLDGQEIREVDADCVVILPWLKKISAGSLILRPN